jgi:hypothetical protein
MVTTVYIAKIDYYYILHSQLATRETETERLFGALTGTRAHPVFYAVQYILFDHCPETACNSGN